VVSAAGDESIRPPAEERHDWLLKGRQEDRREPPVGKDLPITKTGEGGGGRQERFER